MRRNLRKDPIVEARCEFQFDSPDWDWTVPGLLWGQLRKEFPLKQQFDLVAPDTPENSHETLGVSQLNFWSEDKTSVVRTQPNELAVIQRAPYKGWPIFKTMIEQVLSIYHDIEPNGQLASISLRYVNLLPLPSPDGLFDVQKFLTVHPTIPLEGNVPLGAWMQQTEILRSEEISLLFRVGCIPRSPENPDDLATAIDIMARNLSNQVSNGAEMGWLETAHAEIEGLFFACLKQPYLEILQSEEIEDENQTS